MNGEHIEVVYVFNPNITITVDWALKTIASQLDIYFCITLTLQLWKVYWNVLSVQPKYYHHSWLGIKDQLSLN